MRPTTSIILSLGDVFRTYLGRDGGWDAIDRIRMAEARRIEKIMIRAPNWVGDAVMAASAIRYLRAVFQSARITLVCRPVVAGLFESEGFVDEVFVTQGRSFGGLLRDGRTLRRSSFDLSVLLPNSAESALLARLAGARFIVGYPTDWRRPLLTHSIPLTVEFKAKHQVDYYLNLVSAVAQRFCGEATRPARDRLPRLSASNSEKDRAAELLGQFDVDSESIRLLIICPGATNSRAKRWLPERFAGVADRFAALGFQPVIVGSPGDVAVANEVAALIKTSAVMLAGKTDLSTLKGVLSRAAVAVSNDTGTAHVAAALGIPTVVVFGPTEHFSTRPISELCEVVRHEVACSPCMLRDCPIDHRCMTAVTVDEVYNSAVKLMGLGITTIPGNA
ncbi:MAG: lipopolysaccharide heptosyltransferase II [Blastocatellia bacterium]